MKKKNPWLYFAFQLFIKEEKKCLLLHFFFLMSFNSLLSGYVQSWMKQIKLPFFILSPYFGPFYKLINLDFFVCLVGCLVLLFILCQHKEEFLPAVNFFFFANYFNLKKKIKTKIFFTLAICLHKQIPEHNCTIVHASRSGVGANHFSFFVDFRQEEQQ